MHSKDFAELLGAFIGDGWISENKKGGKMLVISGNPKDEKEYYKGLAWLWKNEFGNKIEPREFAYWGTYGIMCCRKDIVKCFEYAGMIKGNKASSCEVPKEILNNEELYAPFIRGVFDTDGSIFFRKSYNKNASKWQKIKHHIPTVQIASVPPSLIEAMRKMLSALGFKFSASKYVPKNKSWNTTYFLRLYWKWNAVRFFGRIKPRNARHLIKFEKWLTKGFY